MPYSKTDIIDALECVAQTGVPSNGAATILDIGTKSYLDFFETEILDKLVTQGGSTCRFYEGTYGSGKTHLLQLFHDMAIRKRMLVVEVELSQILNLTDWHAITKFVLEKIQCRIDRNIVQSLPKILDAIVENGWLPDKSLRSYHLTHTGFVNAIETYLKRNRELRQEAKDRLAQFLLGQKVGALELKRNGISNVKNPLSKRNAELVLNTVLSALYHMGFPGTMILFDETDQTFSISEKIPLKTIFGANIMRRLIDACSLSGIKGVLVGFAVLPNFIPACAGVYQALGERLMVSRKGRTTPGWRSPVLRLDAINTVPDRNEFVVEAVTKFLGFAERLDVKIDLRAQLESVGNEILNKQAGLDFRRALIKRYASVILQYQ